MQHLVCCTLSGSQAAEVLLLRQMMMKTAGCNLPSLEVEFKGATCYSKIFGQAGILCLPPGLPELLLC